MNICLIQKLIAEYFQLSGKTVPEKIIPFIYSGENHTLVFIYLYNDKSLCSCSSGKLKPAGKYYPPPKLRECLSSCPSVPFSLYPAVRKKAYYSRISP